QLSDAAIARVDLAAGTETALVIRPERMRILEPNETPPTGLNGVNATVNDVLYLGPIRKYDLTTAAGQRAVVREQAGASGRDWASGDPVWLAWRIDAGVLLPDPPTAS